jgi:hypothetical protein
MNPEKVRIVEFSHCWCIESLDSAHWRPDICYSIFSFMCIFCRSLFVLLYLLFRPLCCLFFFDLSILITPLVSSNSSSHKYLIFDFNRFHCICHWSLKQKHFAIDKFVWYKIYYLTSGSGELKRYVWPSMCTV